MLNQINSKTHTITSPGPQRETNSFHLTKIKKKKILKTTTAIKMDVKFNLLPLSVPTPTVLYMLDAQSDGRCAGISGQLQYRIILLFGEFICIYFSDVGILFSSMAPLKHRPFHQSSTLFFCQKNKRDFHTKQHHRTVYLNAVWHE